MRQPTDISKKLAVLFGALAMLLAAAVPALAQEAAGQYGEEQYTEVPVTVTATGVLGRAAPHSPDPAPIYAITDEATGTPYELISGFVELEPFVGQRVTIEGGEVPGSPPPGSPVFLNVTSIVPAEDPGGEESVAVAFELAVEGEPPPDATFFASLGYEPAYFRLSDPDGDGLYSAAAPEGYVAAGDVLPARIVQGTGTRASQVVGEAPGEPVSTIKDFGEVRFDEDTTLSASVSFDGPEPPPPGEEVTATGVLKKLDAKPVVVDGLEICGLSTHAITDEATGRRYDLTSEAVDLDGYVGKRVAATGTPLESPAIEEAEPCPDLDVTRVEVLGGPDDDGDGGSDRGARGGIKTLPATGGALTMAGLSGLALVVAGGLLARRRFAR